MWVRRFGREWAKIRSNILSDTTNCVIRDADGGINVADGPHTTPDSRPDHDLYVSSRCVGRRSLVVVQEHVERNVCLGSDGIKRIVIGGGRVFVCRIDRPAGVEGE